MGLNPQGKGPGGGNVFNFKPKGPRARGIMDQRPVFRPNLPGVFCPPNRFPPDSQFGTSSAFGAPRGCNTGRPRPAHRKFPQKNIKPKFAPKIYGVPACEIDLTKPWVTEEIINEETNKQNLLDKWKESNENEDWNKYKAQKQSVETLYNKARTDYAASHPYETALWGTNTTVKHYYCETCDKSFKTDDDLFLHRAEHEVCGREGCEFTAHPKIIAKHVKMQHATGLYKRIGKLYTEEDIVKWIEDRKKNYPTRKVIEEKKILEQEKYNRGERIKDDNSKFNKSFNNKNKRTRKKKFERKIQRSNKTQKTKKNKPVVLKCLEEETSTIRKGVPAFPGIKSPSKPEIPEKKDFDISDEEWETSCNGSKEEKPMLNSSLGLLATLYDSDIENQNEPCRETLKLENTSGDEGSGPEEVSTVSSKTSLKEENLSVERGSLKRKLSGKNVTQERKRKNILNDDHLKERNLTLLEKLLKNEIRHERNVILQCVHYVIKNNFFKL